MDKPLHFVFVNGRPCSGKDAQADIMIKNNESAIKISTGEIIKGAETPDGPFGQYHEQLKDSIEMMRQGRLIPDKVLLPVVFDVIREQAAAGRDTFVFTGFPRTRKQLHRVDVHLGAMRDKGRVVFQEFIFYAVPEGTSYERRGIRVNSAGDNVRIDDEELKTFENRLSEYLVNTEPMLNELRQQRRLAVIRANKPTIEGVTARTNEKLERLGWRQGSPERF